MVMGVTPAQAGLAAARVRGRTGGRKPKMTSKLIDKAQRMYDARQFTMAEIAQSCARGHTIEAPIPDDLRTSQKFQRHAPQTVGPISYPSRQSSAPIRGQTGARSSLALMAAQIILEPQICHGKKGELDHRYERGLENQLSALGLVLNCVVLWTTVYLDAAVRQLKAQGYPVPGRGHGPPVPVRLHPPGRPRHLRLRPCLLYTSD